MDQSKNKNSTFDIEVIKAINRDTIFKESCENAIKQAQSLSERYRLDKVDIKKVANHLKIPRPI